ncbi:hypothetical protein MLD38_008714 [Melastoma candidum]|uniref:Uncharacterized protein n=1 Tax=Melastoma candidum TaxID=119954 RepID=A0ACB9RUP2_9MYRT|nr:hypothetical protein MLD38_008714 [Melastoma candidum]
MSEVNNAMNRLETAESLDWRHLMAEEFVVQKSPLRYFMDEMGSGNSLRSTTTLGNEKERERVYDTIFQLPWRCEMLINVGVFVCFDSFLSLLTIMPTRIVMLLWRILFTRQLTRPTAAELSDFGCFIVLASELPCWRGQFDLSHDPGQGTIKLYVVYNVLEIFDKLCQSFGGDVLQTLFNSAEVLASCTQENARTCTARYFSDLALAVAASNILYCPFVYLISSAITLSTCIVAHNNALLAMLVSNNFAEIKSNVFKRFSKDNIHSIVYYDSIERFHISAFVLFVLAQNILEAEGPWFESFIFNALMVFFCEITIDTIKHSFIAKFNDIKPIVYSEFLEDLCKQVLNTQTDLKKNLTFVPLAPACVVIRVLTPVYAVLLLHHSLPWKLLWALLLVFITFMMLASLKFRIDINCFSSRLLRPGFKSINAASFHDLGSTAGLKKLDEYLLTRSYITGYQASKDDITVHAAFSQPPPAEFVNVSRWYNHIEALLRISGVSGEGAGVTIKGCASVEAVATPPVADVKTASAADDDDDDDVDLFGEETEEEKKAAEERAAAVKASSKKKESGKSSVLLDVKPWDETDMKKLEEAVRSVQMEGLLWGASKLVPVGAVTLSPSIRSNP